MPRPILNLKVQIPLANSDLHFVSSYIQPNQTHTLSSPNHHIMADDAIPVLFTVNGTSRHELILISPTHATLSGVQAEIAQLAESSPNCAEFMGKYKAQPKDEEGGNKEQKQEDDSGVTELRVRWNGQSHDPKIFPASTLITRQNFKAVVKMIGTSGVGRDTLQVTMK